MSQSSAYTVPTSSPWGAGTPRLCPTPQPLRPLPDMAELISSLCLYPKEWGSSAFIGQTHTRGVQSNAPGHPWTCSNHSGPTSAVLDFPITHCPIHYTPEQRSQSSAVQGSTSSHSFPALPWRAFPVSLLRSSCPQEHHCQSVHCSPLLLHGVKKGARGQGKGSHQSNKTESVLKPARGSERPLLDSARESVFKPREINKCLKQKACHSQLIEASAPEP